jgi:SAM-dependent methyltransferase
MKMPTNNKHSRGYYLLRKVYRALKVNTVNRISLDIELKKQFKKIQPGIVLDVGSKYSPYKKYIPYTKYLRLDVDKESEPDLCCDLHDIEWESDYFDTLIATEVLEHLYDPQKAINQIHRVLKKGGICLLSACFLFPYHAFPKDYHRFTKDSLNYLFRDFSKVKIHHYGNKIQVIWHFLNGGKYIFLKNPLILLNFLFARINFKKTNYPLGFVIYAKK